MRQMVQALFLTSGISGCFSANLMTLARLGSAPRRSLTSPHRPGYSILLPILQSKGQGSASPHYRPSVLSTSVLRSSSSFSFGQFCYSPLLPSSLIATAQYQYKQRRNGLNGKEFVVLK